MNLRPHHLLCIQKFTGHGYNEDFTLHMKSVVSQLAAEPQAQITLTQSCDDLCKYCPNNTNGICDSNEKVALMDSAVLDVCGFANGETVLWINAAGKVRKQIFKTGQFCKICSRCQWFELCGNTEVHYE